MCCGGLEIAAEHTPCLLLLWGPQRRCPAPQDKSPLQPGGRAGGPSSARRKTSAGKARPRSTSPPAVSWSCSLWPACPTPAPWGHLALRPGTWRLSLPSCYPGLPSPGPAPRPPGEPTWPSSCSLQPCPVSTKGLGSRRWWGTRQPRRMEPSQWTRTSHAGSLRPSALPRCLQQALCPSPWWLRPHPEGLTCDSKKESPSLPVLAPQTPFHWGQGRPCPREPSPCLLGNLWLLELLLPL